MRSRRSTVDSQKSDARSPTAHWDRSRQSSVNCRLSTLLAALVLFAGCHNDVFLRLTVDGIPSGATTLVAFVSLGGHDATPERFALPSTDSQSFALDLPIGKGGWVDVGVAAEDAQGCDIGWQTTSVAPSTYNAHLLDTSLTLTASPQSCGLQREAGMMYVAAGSFTIGCAALSDPSCKTWETSPRTVSLPAFQIDRTEVSVGAYADCVSAGACEASLETGILALGLPPTAARPFIDWTRADAFCHWRNKRLPAEAEWEAAARGNDGRLYPWGDATPTCTLANFSTDAGIDGSCFGYDLTKNIAGQLPGGASPLGVLDMAGNLSEWTADWYAVRSSLSDAQLTTGPAAGSDRVVKGGSYQFTADFLRGASRIGFPADGSFVASDGTIFDSVTGTQERGFRCAK
jgi:formylglycine-generating enzyme required for sulfatase activity